MPENILEPGESLYLLKKAELIKTYRQIEQSFSELMSDLAGKEEPKSNMVYANASKELKIAIPLDNLTIERFDIVVPYFKKHLEEYHRITD